MAPELFSDGAAHSTASDLWALGCVLYECSMGRPPFLNSSLNQLIAEILQSDPQPIPGEGGIGCTHTACTKVATSLTAFSKANVGCWL